MLNEAKRHKHGHLPGDISRRMKIAFREKRLTGVYAQENPARAAAYRREVAAKSVTKQRQRDKVITDEAWERASEADPA